MDSSLFDPKLITPIKAPPSFEIRPLRLDDFAKGFAALLSQLSDIEKLDSAQFTVAFNEMRQAGSYFIVVIEDLSKKTLVATGSLILERKFLHSAGLCGHIEDVVVKEEYRSHSFGRIILEQLKQIALRKGCYKLCLDCAEKNVPFYEKLGFKRKELQMALYSSKL